MAGLKTSIAVYGLVKAAEGLALYLQGDLTTDFFTEIPGELVKAAISGAVGAAAAGVVIALGAPVAAGIGIAIVFGVGVGIGLDYLDKRIGFTETLSKAGKKLLKNLESWWDKFKSSSSPRAPILFPYLGDPLSGFQFPGEMAYNQRIVPYGKQFVYMA